MSESQSVKQTKLIGLQTKRNKLKATVDQLQSENTGTNLAGFDAQERSYGTMKKELDSWEDDRDNLKRLTSEMQTTVNELSGKLSGIDSHPSGDLTRDFSKFKQSLNAVNDELLRAGTDQFAMPTSNQNIRIKMDADDNESDASSDEDSQFARRPTRSRAGR